MALNHTFLEEGETYRDLANEYAFRILKIGPENIVYETLGSGYQDTEPIDQIERYIKRGIIVEA